MSARAGTDRWRARLKKPSWKDPRLLVGILLVLASVVGVISLVGGADQTTEAYAARHPIAVGEKLTTDKLHRVKVRLGRHRRALPHRRRRDWPRGWLPCSESARTSCCRGKPGQPRALDRKPVAVTIEEPLPPQAVAGSRVDVWVALPDTRNGFSEPALLLPGAEIAQLTAGQHRPGLLPVHGGDGAGRGQPDARTCSERRPTRPRSRSFGTRAVARR